ncbi:MAG: M20/M25/M40 family metallo-hydrolase [Chitinophagaceae bacterium]|nr:M20/M25/M40 family metallo-hydrolase [Chitinophagaceae bacterium]
MKKRLLLWIAAAPLLALAQPQEDAAMIKKISDDILRNGKAYELLYQLTKQVGGRLAGSPQMYKAEAWGQQALAQMGADRVYLQECKVPRWVRGGTDQASVVRIAGKPAARKLDVLALGNSLGSGKPVTAEVITIQDFDELEKRKNDIKGKIVYYNNAFDPTIVKTFIAYGQAGVYRRSGPSRAAKYGAVGVIIRSLTESEANDPHTGGMTYNDSFPKIPALAVGPRDADYLWELGKKSAFSITLKTNGHFLPDTTGHNVIGELKGSEFPDEIITIGGHLDSWDVNEGAHDDGAGVVHTIEILRVFKALGYQPKRTIRFVLFANEENGLRGGTQYAAEAKAKGEKHIFALESDEGGFTPRGFGFTAPKEKLQRIQAWLPLLSPYGTAELSDGGGGADIGPLNRNLGTPLAGFLPDPQRYFDLHHARSDVFENVHKRELLLGAVNMAALIYLVDKYGF